MALALAEIGADFRLLYACRRRDDLALARRIAGAHRRPAADVRRRGRAAGSISTPRSPGWRPAASSTSAARSACWRRPSGAWQQSGRPVEQLRFETFGNSGRFASQPFKVKIPRLDLVVEVPQNQTMLDALEDGRRRHDLRLPARRVRVVRPAHPRGGRHRRPPRRVLQRRGEGCRTPSSAPASRGWRAAASPSTPRTGQRDDGGQGQRPLAFPDGEGPARPARARASR